MRRRKSIPFFVRKHFWAQPCVVCHVPYDIEVDHIVPFSKGGDCSVDNFQPLCRACNQKKKHRLSNEQLRAWVVARGLHHFLEAVYREDTKYAHSFDGPGFDTWMSRVSPERVQHAKDLYRAFCER